MPFVPWRDDVLCDAESPYALLNKASWFQCGRPLDLVRRGALSGADWRYDEPEAWIDRLDDQVLPRVGGVALAERMVQLASRLRREVPVPWRRRYLAVCPICIAHGVHLRVHQHFAVACCPVHPRQRLVSACPRCDRSLPFRIYRRQSAFACTPHGHSLSAEPPQRLSASAAMWARCVRQAESAQAWLDELHARVPLDDTELGPEPAEQVPFRRRLALEAVLRARARVPPWVLRMDLPAQMALRTVPALAPKAPTATGAGRAGADVTRTGDIDHCVAHLASSLRLSAKAFVVRYGADHAGCLDRPYHLLGRWSSLAPSDARLLECCPVAIGFWLWRLRWGPALADLRGAAALQNHTSLVADYRSSLGGVVRSHLHMCVVVARQAVRAHRHGESAEVALQALRGLLGDPRDTACSIPSDLSICVTSAGVPTFWALDVAEPHVAQPLRMCMPKDRAVPSVPCADASIDDHRPVATLPFTPMRHDWAFLYRRRAVPGLRVKGRSGAIRAKPEDNRAMEWGMPIAQE